MINVNIESLQTEINKIKEDKLKAIKAHDFEFATMLRNKEKILLAKIEESKAWNK